MRSWWAAPRRRALLGGLVAVVREPAEGGGLSPVTACPLGSIPGHLEAPTPGDLWVGQLGQLAPCLGTGHRDLALYPHHLRCSTTVSLSREPVGVESVRARGVFAALRYSRATTGCGYIHLPHMAGARTLREVHSVTRSIQPSVLFCTAASLAAACSVAPAPLTSPLESIGF